MVDMDAFTSSALPFKGALIEDFAVLKQKTNNIKAFVFDWDGVFNDGKKDISGNSSFSEIDAMGVNLMRFSYYLQHGHIPVTAIITGENNPLATAFAKREHLHACFYKAPEKQKALVQLCSKHNIHPSEVLFVFDDVLDFSVAKITAVRCMVNRSANPFLLHFAEDYRIADYITEHSGGNHAVREIAEIFMMLSENFHQTIENRADFSASYQGYLKQRNEITTDITALNNNNNLTIVWT